MWLIHKPNAVRPDPLPIIARDCDQPCSPDPRCARAGSSARRRPISFGAPYHVETSSPGCGARLTRPPLALEPSDQYVYPLHTALEIDARATPASTVTSSIISSPIFTQSPEDALIEPPCKYQLRAIRAARNPFAATLVLHHHNESPRGPTLAGRSALCLDHQIEV